MDPEYEEFEKFKTFIESKLYEVGKFQDYIVNGGDIFYADSNKEVYFKEIDEVITDLGVEEFINAIKQSGVWSVRGFKQEDLDAILMLNLDPLIMKLFLTFALGKSGQERVLDYLNYERGEYNNE